MNSAFIDEFKDCCDEQLALMAQQGNLKAENELIARTLPTVRFLSGKYFSLDGSVDSDDFLQEALIGVVAAIRGFDLSRGVAFITYASVCVRNRLNRFFSGLNENRASTVGLNVGGEISDMLSQVAFDTAEENVPEMLSKIKGYLTELEWNVWRLYAKNYKTGEIAGILGINKKSAENALGRANKKLRELFKNI